MNVLVVLEGSISPFLSGLAVVAAWEVGVASLLTSCVWPLCKAGLAQGSASRFSKESFRSRRDFPGELEGVVWLACEVGLCCLDDAFSSFSETLTLLNCLM